MQARKIMGEEGREYILAKDSDLAGGAAGGKGKGNGGGSGRRRDGSGKVDQLAVAAAARAAQRNVGMPAKLAAAIPLAAFKGFATVAGGAAAAAVAAVEVSGRRSSDDGGGIEWEDAEVVAGGQEEEVKVEAKGAVVELRLSDDEGASGSGGSSLFGGCSSTEERQGLGGGGMGGADGAEADSRVQAGVGLQPAAGGSGGLAAAAAAVAAGETAALEDVEWEDVAAEAAAPSIAGTASRIRFVTACAPPCSSAIAAAYVASRVACGSASCATLLASFSPFALLIAPFTLPLTPSNTSCHRRHHHRPPSRLARAHGQPPEAVEHQPRLPHGAQAGGLGQGGADPRVRPRVWVGGAGGAGRTGAAGQREAVQRQRGLGAWRRGRGCGVGGCGGRRGWRGGW